MWHRWTCPLWLYPPRLVQFSEKGSPRNNCHKVRVKPKFLPCPCVWATAAATNKTAKIFLNWLSHMSVIKVELVFGVSIEPRPCVRIRGEEHFQGWEKLNKSGILALIFFFLKGIQKKDRASFAVVRSLWISEEEGTESSQEKGGGPF